MRYEGLRPNFDRKMLRESGPRNIVKQQMLPENVSFRNKINVMYMIQSLFYLMPLHQFSN